ncbi:MAG: flippase [Elusimicrobia bacterium]|nr:flippase [Elusimicrobiota bacterium]MBU2615159.1 flippase [Elusimicrobiota bacterium]
MNQETNKRIFKNMLYLNSSAVLAKILGFATSIILARKLGETQFGQYIFIFSFISYFMLLNDLGLNILTARDVARNHNDALKYLNEISGFKLILVFISFCLFICLIFVLPYSNILRIALIFGFLYVGIKSFGIFFGSFLSAFERLDINAVLDFIFTLLVLIFILIISQLKMLNLVNVMAVYTLAIFIWAAATLIVLFNKFIPFKIFFRPNFSFVKQSYVFALGSIAGTIMLQTDTVILKFMSGDAATGYYGIGLTFVVGLMFLGLSFCSAMYPVFSRLFKEAKEEIRSYFEKSIETLFKITMPFAVGGSILAGKIILLFYGVNYLPAKTSFEILMLASLFLALGNFMAAFLQAVNQQKNVVKINVIGIAVNLVLSGVLIYYFSYAGAAIARAGTFIYLVVLYWFVIRKELQGVKILPHLLKPLIAGFVMAVALFVLYKLNVIVLLFIGITVYITVLVAIKGFSKEEFSFVKSCFKKQCI